MLDTEDWRLGKKMLTLLGSGQGKLNPLARGLEFQTEFGGENYPGNNVFLPVELVNDGDGSP